MDGTTFELFGITFKSVYFHAGLFFLALFGGAGAVLWAKAVQRYHERGNKQLDHYLDSMNEVSEIDKDGFRTLKIRNKGNVERCELVVRGKKERGWLLAAARCCDWTHRFVKDHDPAHQKRILHVLRNTVSRHFVAGENAHNAGLPTVSFDLYGSPTGADASVGGVLMIRNILAKKDVLEIVLSHPVDKWKYEDDMGEAQDHSVRITTLREMATALLKNNGYKILEDGSRVKIVFWLEARVPV